MRCEHLQHFIQLVDGKVSDIWWCNNASSKRCKEAGVNCRKVCSNCLDHSKKENEEN